MHGCRECDWDACETCTDKLEGGTVKWGHILELAVACRKVLDDTEEGHASMDDADGMKIDEPLGCSTKISVSRLQHFGTPPLTSEGVGSGRACYEDGIF